MIWNDWGEQARKNLSCVVLDELNTDSQAWVDRTGSRPSRRLAEAIGVRAPGREQLFLFGSDLDSDLV